MYLEMDASWGHAIYELKAPYAECRAVIDAEPAVEPTHLEASELAEGFKEVRAWFDDTPEAISQSPGAGRPLLGTVQMKEGLWKVEASSGARLDRLRQLLEERLGPRLRFVRERRDDLGTRMAGTIPMAGDADLIPPRLVERIDAPGFTISKLDDSTPIDPVFLVEAVRQRTFEKFPDEPVPMLDGRTPREAAQDPGLRKQLLALMKIHVRGVDEENLRKGAASDINPLLRELGLHEIDFPPPPRRAIPRGEQDEDEDGNEVPPRPRRTPAASGPPLPPLPGSRPLTAKEAGMRVRSAIDAFELAGDALEAMSAAGSTLIEDLLQVTHGLISDQDFNFVVPHLIPAWFALVPRDGPAPVIPAGVLRAALLRDLKSFGDPRAQSAPDSILRDHRQPEVALLLTGQCMDTFVRAPKGMKPSLEAQVLIIRVISTVINEIDRAVRG
jgi:hypothetical protein